MARYLSAALLVVLFTLAEAAGPTLHNRLAQHPSPYLAMHAGDPVHWQTWRRETLLEAQRLDRPLLVSIGYFACHWCHVMQRESFSDAGVAHLMNQYFVPVKVDRELEPALDTQLLEFVQMTRGHSGWPLNVILTPEGYPLLGFVYLPKDEFRALLEQFRGRWRDTPQQLRELARAALQEWGRLRTAEPAAPVTPGSAVTRLLAQAEQQRDELSGGFGQQSKFPMVPQLRALLDAHARRPDADTEAFLRLTLQGMAEQGLRDILGGGFFRYTVDPGWQTPHFEKMLYDNAQLAMLYFQAAGQFDEPAWHAVATDTLDFMLAEMRRDDGAFISSLSAVDAQGREGYYYLWDRATLERVLNPRQLAAVSAAWLPDQPDELEYGNLPRWQGSAEAVARKLGWSPEVLTQVLASARVTLLAERRKRSLPADRKALAAWNGLALSALAAGYAATGDTRYAQAARRLVDYLQTELIKDDSLLRARGAGRVLAEASLEDYALVAQGLSDWQAQDPHPRTAQRIQRLTGRLLLAAWRRYYRNDRWLMNDEPLIPVLEGQVAIEDGPLPSASATIAVLTRSDARLRANDEINRKLDRHLDAARRYLGDSLFWYASYTPLLDAPSP
jgi:uncharacterized protein YyaL (SSP411 family)